VATGRRGDSGRRRREDSTLRCDSGRTPPPPGACRSGDGPTGCGCGIFDWGIVGTVEHRWLGWDPHDSHGNTMETAWEGKVEHCMAHQGEKRVWVKSAASDEVRAKN
jgi:hypothetical protein